MGALLPVTRQVQVQVHLMDVLIVRPIVIMVVLRVRVHAQAVVVEVVTQVVCLDVKDCVRLHAVLHVQNVLINICFAN